MKRLNVGGEILLCIALCLNFISCNNSTGPQGVSVSLSGTILKTDGTPLQGATVTTFNFEKSTTPDLLTAQTDNRGLFSIKGTYLAKTTSSTSSGLAKITDVRDTILAVKKNNIDVKVAIDSYTKQNISATMSEGVLKQLFQINNSMIPGWKMKYSTLDSSFSLWSVYDLWADIDGGFEVYTSRGMLQAADLAMLGPINSEGNPNELAIHSFIMDFGTESNTKIMYDYQKSQYFDADASLLPGYTNDVAFAKSALGGVTAYAYYKQFYFELILINYTETAGALAAAKQFLDYFKSKAQ